jgi:hypothetical protein
MTDKRVEILAFVRKYVAENNRGCPKNYVLHVGGFKAKDIAALVEFGILESGRGSEGGLFPAGEKPTPKTVDNVSLKSQAIELLRKVMNGEHVERADAAYIVRQYDAEIARRAESQK